MVEELHTLSGRGRWPNDSVALGLSKKTPEWHEQRWTEKRWTKSVGFCLAGIKPRLRGHQVPQGGLKARARKSLLFYRNDYVAAPRVVPSRQRDNESTRCYWFTCARDKCAYAWALNPRDIQNIYVHIVCVAQLNWIRDDSPGTLSVSRFTWLRAIAGYPKRQREREREKDWLIDFLGLENP